MVNPSRSTVKSRLRELSMSHKICAISDLHGNLPNIPDCELLLIAGDILPFEYQKDFAKNKLTPWLRRLEERKITVVACAGNHDIIFYENPKEAYDLPWIYLQDDSREVLGYNIYGCPWSEEYGGWPFMAKKKELDAIYDKIPSNTDILVVHGPPYGYGDGVYEDDMDLKIIHVGSRHLLIKVMEINPKLVVFGHIHQGRGQFYYDKTILANVTVVNQAVNFVYEPMLFEI